MYCKHCNGFNYDNAQSCTTCGATLQDAVVVSSNETGKRCPSCGGYNCLPMTDSKTTGSDFSAGSGCCGYLLFGPIGLLCGLCGGDKKTVSKHFWVCPNCGNKFKM
ncbi:MAG: hypothetical protein GX896_04305 [Clostridiales bacterium]|nr:hypothetical protein [Clostridiales bacterium]